MLICVDVQLTRLISVRFYNVSLYWYMRLNLLLYLPERGLNHYYICVRYWRLSGLGVAVRVSLHFGRLGPKSSWSDVRHRTSGHSSLHLPALSLNIWALYIHVDIEIDYKQDVA